MSLVELLLAHRERQKVK